MYNASNWAHHVQQETQARLQAHGQIERRMSLADKRYVRTNNHTYA